MLAKGLMIGDIAYVRLPNGVEPINVATIGKVSIEDIEGHSWDVIQLKPILLSEEILIANGFSKMNTQLFQLGEYESDCYIKINIKRGCAHINGLNHNNVNLYGTIYVHDLQHALRLCGLNELADNFVIPKPTPNCILTMDGSRMMKNQL